jgi:hypothetical protein
MELSEPPPARDEHATHSASVAVNLTWNMGPMFVLVRDYGATSTMQLTGAIGLGDELCRHESTIPSQ